MEVLKSGEALEKQVLEDARTKASRILAEADRECAVLREEWQRKAEQDIRKIEADRDSRIAAVRQELGASLPLDLMRARLSYIQESVGRAMDQYFAKLAPADLGRIVGGMLRRMPPVFQGAKAIAYVSGISPQEAKRIVEENVPGVSLSGVKEMLGGSESTAGLVLETEDGRIRFRGTLQELSAQLLEKYREELATSLLGRDV
jgi:vacuolar-type H+-ATPase subunit E/Vma4